MADQSDMFEFETSPDRFVIRNADSKAICHTNHCLDSTHQSWEGEAASDSSKARLQRMEDALATGNQAPSTIKALFANRDDGVHSINRYAEDEQGTATNSVFIARPHERIAYACRGPADRGQWYQLDCANPTPTAITL